MHLSSSTGSSSENSTDTLVSCCVPPEEFTPTRAQFVESAWENVNKDTDVFPTDYSIELCKNK